MKTDIVHVTKYEFSFDDIQELKIIQRGGSYLSPSYTDLWMVTLFEDCVYFAFFVTKSKYMESAIGCTISREQFRDITMSMPKQISVHEDSLIKGEDGVVKLFYNDDLHKVYDSFPKFVNKP